MGHGTVKKRLNLWVFRGISGLKEVDVVISCCAR